MTPQEIEELGPYTSLGSYTILYWDSDGDAYCWRCAQEEAEEDPENTIQEGTFDEGPPASCCGCGELILSSYGEIGELAATDFLQEGKYEKFQTERCLHNDPRNRREL